MVADDMEKRDAQFRKRLHISVVHAHLVVNQIAQYQGEITFRSIRSHQLPHIGNTFFPEIADLFVILDLRVADGQHHPRFRTIQFLKREIARLRRFERTERPEEIGNPRLFQRGHIAFGGRNPDKCGTAGRRNLITSFRVGLRYGITVRNDDPFHRCAIRIDDASVHGQRLLGQTHAEIIDHRGLAGNKDQAQGRPNQIFNPFHRTNYLRSHMTQFSLSSPSY